MGVSDGRVMSGKGVEVVPRCRSDQTERGLQRTEQPREPKLNVLAPKEWADGALRWALGTRHGTAYDCAFAARVLWVWYDAGQCGKQRQVVDIDIHTHAHTHAHTYTYAHAHAHAHTAGTPHAAACSLRRRPPLPSRSPTCCWCPPSSTSNSPGR